MLLWTFSDVCFLRRSVLCMDDDNVRSIRPRVTKPVIGYGLSHDATVRAIDVTADGTRMRFTVLRLIIRRCPSY